jgi:hypothetical protein
MRVHVVHYFSNQWHDMSRSVSEMQTGSLLIIEKNAELLIFKTVPEERTRLKDLQFECMGCRVNATLVRCLGSASLL